MNTVESLIFSSSKSWRSGPQTCSKAPKLPEDHLTLSGFEPFAGGLVAENLWRNH